MTVEDLLKRFSESKEAESYIKYYYPFHNCFHKFWSSQPEILQELSAGQMSLLEQKFIAHFIDNN